MALCIVATVIVGICQDVGARVQRLASEVSITVCRFAVGDIDGDGKAEIVVGGRVGAYSPLSSQAGIEVCRLSPTGGVTVLAATLLGEVITDVAIADVDGDGRSEIIAVGGTSMHLFEYVDDEIQWRQSNSLARGRAVRVEAADVDGDGRAEIVVAEVVFSGASEVASSVLSVYSWSQGPHLLSSHDLDGHVGDLSFGDFGGDGDLQLAIELGAEELGGLIKTFAFDDSGELLELGAQQLSDDGARILNLSALQTPTGTLLASGEVGGRIAVWSAGATGLRRSGQVALPRHSGLFHGLLFVPSPGIRLLAATAQVGSAGAGEVWELSIHGP